MNSTPTIGTPSISPSSGISASTNLTCSATATDINDGALNVTYVWSASNGGSSTGSTWQLTSSVVSSGVTIYCTASATDSNGSTVSSTSSSVTVGNSAPTISNVTITPSSGVVTGSALTCSATGSDPDDGSLTPAYVWTVNGSTVGTGSTYSVSASDTNVGDSVLCTATVTDSGGQTATANSSVMVQNSAPTVSNGPTLSTSQVEIGDTLTCTASGADVDGDVVSLSYVWTDSSGNNLTTGNSLQVSNISVGETIVCTVTPSDGTVSGSSSTSNAATVVNSAPTIGTPSISPSSGISASTNLTCSATATDINDGALNVTYVWSASNGSSSTGSTWQLTSSVVSSGVTIYCTASATDSNGSTVSSTSSSVTVGNSTPSISSVVISPSSGVVTGSALTCSATGSDPDDGSLTPAYVWTVNGSTVGTGSTYSVSASDTNVGDYVMCTATVTDSGGASASGSDTALVTNTAPTLSNLNITSSGSFTNDTTLECTVIVTDPDETLTPSFSWRLNGSGIASGSSIDLNNYSIVPGDVLECVASVSDSVGASASLSDTRSITNRSPNTPTVLVDNQSPEANDTLTCTASATDPDGDAVTLSYNWYVNFNNIGSTNSITLTPSIVSPGDMILCTVVAIDSNGSTAASNDYVYVQNTHPSVTTPSISPSSGVNSSTVLTCSATATDLNDGSLNVSYTWSASNGSSGVGSSWQLSSSLVSPGNTIACTATATDSDGMTVSSTSTTITVENRTPTVGNVSISPNSSGSVITGATLTCSASATDDEDGALTPSYVWQSSGNTLGTGSTYTIDSQVSTGDVITCTATAVDSHGGTASGSASVVMTNTNPQITDLQITPDPGYNDDTYTCTATATDADGDAITIAYQWTDSQGSTLSSTDSFDASTVAMDPGDTFSCTAVATDTSGGQDSSSVSTVLSNRSPNTPVVYISWNGVGGYPQQGDTLYCNVTNSSVYDPDGTAVSTSYSWFAAVNMGTQNTPVLNGSYVIAGEAYSCVVTLSDGSLTSQGADLVQATTRGGTQIQSSAIMLAPVEDQCDGVSCGETLVLPDSSVLEFSSVLSGVEPLGQYELTQDVFVMTSEMTQGSVDALVGVQPVDLGPVHDTIGSFGIGSEYPMYNITWHQAAWIANETTIWHNQTTGDSLQSCFTCNGTGENSVCVPVSAYTQCTGYRLPTQAEWEYAARSTSDLDFWTVDGPAVVSGDTCSGLETLIDGVNNPLASLYSNFCGFGQYGTSGVGTLIPNGFGLFDMHGNVAEWTVDDSSCAFPSSVVDPYCSSGSQYKVVRGGSWVDTLLQQTAASSENVDAATFDETIGLRLFRTQ